MYGRQRKVEKDVWISIGDFVDTWKLDSQSKTIPPKTLCMEVQPNKVP